jgi:hypothetical protein
MFIEEKWLGLKVLNGFKILPRQLLSKGTCVSRTQIFKEEQTVMSMYGSINNSQNKSLSPGDSD